MVVLSFSESDRHSGGEKPTKAKASLLLELLER